MGNDEAAKLLFFLINGKTTISTSDINEVIASVGRNWSRHAVTYIRGVACKRLNEMFDEAYDEMMTRFHWQTFPAISLWG